MLVDAGLGGTTYWCAIFPVDCIKSAMQTDSLIKGERKYPDIMTTARVSASLRSSALRQACFTDEGKGMARQLPGIEQAVLNERR